MDAPLPQEVAIRADDCLAADAVGNYRLESAPQRQRFIRISGDQLRAGQSRPLGWLRCQQLTPRHPCHTLIRARHGTPAAFFRWPC
ncbi:hypothetical protein M5585_01715 [Serratia ureilytica]